MKFKIFRFKKVQSTNNTALRIIKNSNYNYGMIISDTQTRGRGQYYRKWISYKGNLFISFFYSLENFNYSLNKLTKINCLLVKKLISKYSKNKIYFKKPNDLLINRKKICGILQEKVNKFDKKFLIVGIGINLIKKPIINNYPTVCLNEVIKKRISKEKIEKDIKKIFENNFSKLYQKKFSIL